MILLSLAVTEKAVMEQIQYKTDLLLYPILVFYNEQCLLGIVKALLEISWRSFKAECPDKPQCILQKGKRLSDLF